jgi:5-methylcytosine-specific restriction endonuclease McrA
MSQHRRNNDDYYSSLAWRLLAAQVTYDASCVHCGSRHDLVAHHRIPRIYGGADVLSNLEPVCRSCHPKAEAAARARAVAEGRQLIGVAGRRTRIRKRRQPQPNLAALLKALTKTEPGNYRY